jgi:translation elongation factor EF-G
MPKNKTSERSCSTLIESQKLVKFMMVLPTMDWMEQEQERGITITSASYNTVEISGDTYKLT